MSMPCARTANPCMPRANPTAAERTEPANRPRSMVDNLLWKNPRAETDKEVSSPDRRKRLPAAQRIFLPAPVQQRCMFGAVKVTSVTFTMQLFSVR
jgi:hypothetical protein